MDPICNTIEIERLTRLLTVTSHVSARRYLIRGRFLHLRCQNGVMPCACRIIVDALFRKPRHGPNEVPYK